MLEQMVQRYEGPVHKAIREAVDSADLSEADKRSISQILHTVAHQIGLMAARITAEMLEGGYKSQ